MAGGPPGLGRWSPPPAGYPRLGALNSKLKTNNSKLLVDCRVGGVVVAREMEVG